MKFTSLTTMIFAAAMVGVAVASDNDNLAVTPENLYCSPADRAGCSRGLTGFNNGMDYVYFCGSNNKITQYNACPCTNCCIVVSDGEDAVCNSD
ncbi:hypothetical protein EDB19DRAFT_547442 [Suillus lakei]|nr:hypothetical protein EDB19DRAFT_547442 [Suillus lakei]